MPVDIDRGCPGHVLASGRTLGICIADCRRHGVRTALPQLPAAAAKGPGGVWGCPNQLPLSGDQTEE